LPPGRQIYDALGVEETSETVLGIEITTLVIAVFNGVIYGVIIWLISYVLEKTALRKKKEERKKKKKKKG
jgi:large-conductance mechanosensitive channel